MKVFATSAIVLSAALCCLTSFAQAPATDTERWDACLAGFWFHSPVSIATANVIGLKMGLPIASGDGKVVGFEWSFICGATANVKGFQWAMVGANASENVSGMQMAMVNSVSKDLSGVQFGVVNDCDQKGVQIGIVNSANDANFQFGLVNLNKDGWLPFMVLFNHGK